jgi:glycosyltransferase involved in cell wall biosynthesis
VITGLGRGGAETQLVALSRYLESRGWPIEVVSLLPVTRFSEERFVAELESRGISVWSPGITGYASVVRGLWRLLGHLRARKPQVLCTFMFHANVLGAIQGRLAGVPVVVSSIRNERFGPRWREKLEAVTQGLCDVTVVNSEIVAASLVARGIVRKDRCRVIPNAVDVARFSPGQPSMRESTRRRFGASPEAFLWLAVGSLDPQKDHEGLLRAAARLRERHPCLRIAIAGDGPLRESLRRVSHGMALEDTVCWLGLRTDVPDLLVASDAFVLSSRWEGSPNALLEALAAAVPVVATDVGGVRELVQNGRSGFLVPPGDVDALATTMERVMNLTREERQQMGRRGRQSVRQRHDAATVLEHWRHLLSEVWRRKHRAGGSTGPPPTP